MADWVCTLILSSDLPAIDIEIEKNKVRERCLELYPDREELYKMVSRAASNDCGSSSEGRVPDVAGRTASLRLASPRRWTSEEQATDSWVRVFEPVSGAIRHA